ncbi:MAG: hypothetical protein U0234_09625 [Sandaracinus sp.]
MTSARLALCALAFSSLALAGCECGTPITPGACTSNAQCSGGAVCVDRHCTQPMDGGGHDGGRDAAVEDTGDHDAVAVDAARYDANCIPVTCGTTELCFNGVDDDCDDSVDEHCSCVPGSTARCLPGRPDPSTPRCSWGEMVCAGGSEFGEWGACTGAGGGDAGITPYGCRRIGIMGAPGANTSSNFQTWLEMQGAIAMRFHADAAAPTLHIEELRTFDLVVVDWLQRTYTTEEATTLAQWVNEGGGLFVMTGHDSGHTADRQISLLSQLGPNYDRRDCSACMAGEVCDGGICVLNGPANLLPTPLTGDGAGGTLPPISFYGGLQVSVPASMSSTFLPFATIGTYVVGAYGPIGAGHAVIFGDEWIEFDSEWSTMPPIPRFWQQSVSWASPDPMIAPACP